MGRDNPVLNAQIGFLTADYFPSARDRGPEVAADPLGRRDWPVRNRRGGPNVAMQDLTLLTYARLRALLAETVGRLTAERVGKLDDAALAPLIAALRGGELDIRGATERLLKELAETAEKEPI